MEKIILASASPRRREILSQANIEFEVVTADIDESMEKGIPPHLSVQQIALKKGAAVAAKVKDTAYIISADTIVCINEKILGKPENEDEAFKMLSSLSGNVHRVLTGVCIMHVPSGEAATFCESTKVYFKNVSGSEILSYIKSGEPMDKAGAYGIQGKGTFLIEKIEGDYQNVVGLPLSSLVEFSKKEFGLTLNKE